MSLFFLATLAVLPSLARYRGDERYYTDAAIRMVQSGDWLTPFYADGSLRFRKPILPYWAVAVPFKLFGIGVTTSRLGSLLAATITLLLTYRLTRIFSRDRRQALLAVAVMLSNPHLLMMAARATTDALQVASATLALVGLAGILFDRRRVVHLACFWIGVGLVAASKGGLAVALLAFAIGFVGLRGRHSDVRLRDLFHAPTLLIGAIIGLGWFAAILFEHGHVAWNDFWQDQVGGRLQGGGPVTMIANLGSYLVGMPMDAAPFSLLLLVSVIFGWPALRAFFAERREQLWFAVGWYALLLIVFAIANIQRARYCLPAYAPMAAVTSGLFLRMWEVPRAARFTSITVASLIALCGALGAALLALGWRIDPRVSIGGGVTLLLSALAITSWWRTSGSSDASTVWRHCLLLAVFTLVIMRVNDGITREPLFPAAGPQLLSAVQAHTQPGRAVAAVGMPPGQCGQLRLLERGERAIVPLPSDTTPDVLAAYDAILFVDVPDHAPRLPAGYEKASAGTSHLGWRVGEVVAVAIGTRTREAIDAGRSTLLAIAWRSSPQTRPTRVDRPPPPLPASGSESEDTEN